jgi:hypothetical protein
MGDGCSRIVAARWMKAQCHGRGLRRVAVMFPAYTWPHTLGDKVISGSGRALPPFPTRLKSTIFSPLVGLECSNTGYGGARRNPSVRARPLPLWIRVFSKIQNPTGFDVNYLSFNPYNRRAFTLSRGDSFTRVVPEASAIGQRLATR